MRKPASNAIFLAVATLLLFASPVARAQSVFGDVNGSGQVEAADVQLVINAALGIPSEYDCDLDGSGQVQAADVQLVINAALGLIEPEPEGVLRLTNDTTDEDIIGCYLVDSNAKDDDWGANLLDTPLAPGESRDLLAHADGTYNLRIVTAPPSDHSDTTDTVLSGVALASTDDYDATMSSEGLAIASAPADSTEPVIYPDFTFSPSSGPAPLKVEFTAHVNWNGLPEDSIWWNFEGYEEPTLFSTITHTFEKPGSYSVKLRVLSEGVENSIIRGPIVVKDPVVASFTADPAEGAAPLGVAFRNTSQVLDGVDTFGWHVQWDFGDGDSYLGNWLDIPYHTYETLGVYTATMTAMLPNDLEYDAEPVQIEVKSLVDFSVKGSCGDVAPFETRFTCLTDDINDVAITGWDWHFGDGSSSAGVRNPSHYYYDAGVYTVTLTVDLADGSQETATQDIDVPVCSAELRDYYPMHVGDFWRWELLTSFAEAMQADHGLAETPWGWAENRCTGETTINGCTVYTVSVAHDDYEGNSGSGNQYWVYLDGIWYYTNSLAEFSALPSIEGRMVFPVSPIFLVASFRLEGTTPNGSGTIEFRHGAFPDACLSLFGPGDFGLDGAYDDLLDVSLILTYAADKDDGRYLSSWWFLGRDLGTVFTTSGMVLVHATINGVDHYFSPDTRGSAK